MTRHIERQIDQLKQRILHVGTMVEEAISKAITALINHDVPLRSESWPTMKKLTVWK